MLLLLAALLAGTALAPGAEDGGDPTPPRERLVLAVVGNERSGSAAHGERAVVADPRTGELASRVLPGGTLCHGPLLAVGDRVVWTGYRGSRAVAMSLPLTLNGTPRPLGRADDAARTRLLPGGRRAWPIATRGSRLAWCQGECRSVSVRSPDGPRTFRAPAHLRPQPGADGAFSPDGTRLALPATGRGHSRAAVLDLRTGEWSAVPGVRLSFYAPMAWSTSGDLLYLATAGDSLRAWKPGAPRAELLPVQPGGTVMSIAVSVG